MSEKRNHTRARPAFLFDEPLSNLLPASVGDGVLRTPFGDVPFDTARLAGRSEHADLHVAGIRPEQLDAETPRTQLIATLDAETSVAEGQQIELALDPGDLHLFDPVSGTRLTHEPLPRAA
jgi:hypothetical protein